MTSRPNTSRTETSGQSDAHMSGGQTASSKANGAHRKQEDIKRRQAEFVRKGELEKALTLASNLERLGAAVERERGREIDRKVLSGVLERARRNAELIASARDGVKAAREMISRPRETGFSGYDADGKAFRVGR